MLIKINKLINEGFPAPAVANAIFNAVGVRIRECPITPEKVLMAIQNNE